MMCCRQWLVVGCLGLCVSGSFGASLEFAQDPYVVIAGESASIRVDISYGPGEPTNLFSYGVRLQASDPGGISVNSISVPAPLDFNGVFGPGALVDPAPAVLGVKGTIAPVTPLAPYPGSLLATYDLVFSGVGPVTLDLDFWRTVGPNEDVFVAGDGTSLDDSIVLGSTTVWVITRPFLTIRKAVSPSPDIEIEFETVNGVLYIIEETTDYESWADLTTIMGDGGPVVFTHVDARNTSDQRGYRVRVEIPSL